MFFWQTVVDHHSYVTGGYGNHEYFGQPDQLRNRLNITEDFKGRKARGAESGGWLSFDMDVLPDEPRARVIEYWGGFTGSKISDILVDGQKIATENISGKKDGAFLDVSYQLPPIVTAGKTSINVKFDPHTGPGRFFTRGR